MKFSTEALQSADPLGVSWIPEYYTKTGRGPEVQMKLEHSAVPSHTRLSKLKIKRLRRDATGLLLGILPILWINWWVHVCTDRRDLRPGRGDFECLCSEFPPVAVPAAVL